MTTLDDSETKLLRRLCRSGRLYCPKLFGWFSTDMQQKILEARARSEKYLAARAAKKNAAA